MFAYFLNTGEMYTKGRPFSDIQICKQKCFFPLKIDENLWIV